MSGSTRTRPICLVALLTLLPVTACGNDEGPTDTTTGLANPASVFCVEQGGTLEIVDEEGGQVGYCNLPDGRRIEEWEYYWSQVDEPEEP